MFRKNSTIEDWKKPRNSDWEPTDVNQNRREEELEEKEKATFKGPLTDLFEPLLRKI